MIENYRTSLCVRLCFQADAMAENEDDAMNIAKLALCSMLDEVKQAAYVRGLNIETAKIDYLVTYPALPKSIL